jgi:hypothetical protein
LKASNGSSNASGFENARATIPRSAASFSNVEVLVIRVIDMPQADQA